MFCSLVFCCQGDCNSESLLFFLLACLFFAFLQFFSILSSRRLIDCIFGFLLALLCFICFICLSLSFFSTFCSLLFMLFFFLFFFHLYLIAPIYVKAIERQVHRRAFPRSVSDEESESVCNVCSVSLNVHRKSNPIKQIKQ